MMTRRSSIRVKLFVAISVVALVFIGVLLLLNVFFYNDYYMLTLRNELRGMYQNVWRSYEENSDDAAALLDTLENRSATRLSIVKADGTVLYYSSFGSEPSHNGEPPLKSPFPGFGIDDHYFRRITVLTTIVNNINWTQLKNYQFLTVAVQKEQYLCLVGKLQQETGDYLIAYTPYAYIKTNTSFNMVFLLIAGGCSLLICLFCAYFISRQFSRSLIAMAEVADRMSELDFSTKYKGNERDEIGQLGSSLNRLSAYLEQAIGELQCSNEQLAQEIREKERIDNMRREFIVNVSHELKTPIALIQGYAEGLTAGVAEDPEDRKFYCDTIAEEAQHMNQLVMQLLSLSRLELGAEQTYYEEVDLYTLCEESVHKTAVLCESRGLTVQYEKTHQNMYTDSGLLEQVLMNYLSNAIRYTVEQGTIIITAQETAIGMRLSVFNEGDGLPEEELPKIWEKFYRTDRARSRELGGTGIGLSLVRAIADTLHGTCGVENVPGGIVFWFEVPKEQK